MGHQFVSELRRWDVVSGLCQSIDAKTYVEIGCKDGQTTGRVLAQCPDLRAIAIDPWCQQEAGADVTRETYESWNFEKIEAEFYKNLSDNKSRCLMVQSTSEAAALWYKDGNRRWEPKDWNSERIGELDVVFIDALHDYESVKQDISLWWPLVREGGYLCGHDYQHRFPGVMRAVAEAFPLFKVGLAPDSVWFVRKEVLQ